MSKHNDTKLYKFTFSGDLVTAVHEVRQGRVKLESVDHDETYLRDGANVIKIELEHGRQEITTYSDADGDGYFTKSSKSYVSAAASAVRAMDRDYDHDQADDLNHEAGEYHGVYPGADDPSQGSQHFDAVRKTSQQERWSFITGDGSRADGDLLDSSDAILAMLELGRGGWKLEDLKRGETLKVQTVEASAFVVQSEAERDGSYEFSVYSDADGDALWQKVLEGHAGPDHAGSSGVELVGLLQAGLLDPAMLGL